MNPHLPFAIPLVLILGGLSFLHAYWALGGRWGSAHAVPVVNGAAYDFAQPARHLDRLRLPRIRVDSRDGESGWVGTGSLRWLFDAGIWGLSLIFLARTVGDLRTFGFFKKIASTSFARWDTWLYTPLCLLIALLAAGLAQ